MTDVTKEQCEDLNAQVEDVKAKLEAGTHEIDADGKVVEK